MFLNFRHGLLDFIGAIQDVTQQRLAEQALTKVRSELAHVSRVTSLGTLTASIAHEVNQPLAAVIASADSCTAWLASVPPNLDKARVAADRVIRAATQASEIVQLNHPDFGSPVSYITSPLFGQAVQTLSASLGSGGSKGGINPLYQIGGPRSVQLALKLIF